MASQGDWDRAADIFVDRLETRYLEHARCLLERPTSGFAVLTIDSAVIETLEQFRRGVASTPPRKGKEYFVSLLTTTAFADDFNRELAEIFYREIRCGLLHQSEAQGTSRVKRNKHTPLARLTVSGEGIVINTLLFHRRLEQVVKTYAAQVRVGDELEVRHAFRKKMDYICRAEEGRTT